MHKKFYYSALGAFITCGIVIANIGSNYDKAECMICFTPGQNCTKKIIDQIDSAKQEILVQSYSFTSEPIADALMRAHKRKVKIICLFDKSYEKQILILKMKNEGIEVKIDQVSGIAHNKVMIIDEYLVLTGSFNFTKAAQHRNVENSLHIKSEEIAKKYKENFQKRYQLSRSIYH